jgi:hypothetical protein
MRGRTGGGKERINNRSTIKDKARTRWVVHCDGEGGGDDDSDSDDRVMGNGGELLFSDVVCSPCLVFLSSNVNFEECSRQSIALWSFGSSASGPPLTPSLLLTPSPSTLILSYTQQQHNNPTTSLTHTSTSSAAPPPPPPPQQPHYLPTRHILYLHSLAL